MTQEKTRSSGFRWWTLLLAALLVGTAVAVTTGWIADRLEEGAAARAIGSGLSAILGRPAALTAVDVSPFAGEFVLRGFQLGGEPSEHGPTPPGFSIEEVRGQLDWRSLLPTQLHLRELAVEGLALRGTDDGGVPREPANRFSLGSLLRPLLGRFSFSADRMTVSGTTIGYRNRPTPWEVRADAVALDFDISSGQELGGEILSGLGVLRFWDLPDFPMELTATFRIRRELLHVERLALASAFLEVELRGTLDLDDDLSGPLVMTGRGDAGALGRFFFEQDALDTEGAPWFDFEGIARFEEVGFVVDGDFRLPGGSYFGVPLRDWSGVLHWDPERVEILSSQGLAAGGPATFRLRQVQPREENPALLVVSVEDASFADAASGFSGIPTALRSRLSLDADLLMPLSDPTAMTGTIRASGIRPAPTPFPGAPSGPPQVPFGFDGSLVVDEERVVLDHLMIEGGAFRVQGAGEHPRGAPGHASFSGLAGELAEADTVQQELRQLFFGEPPEDTFWDVAGAAGFEGTVSGSWPDMVIEGEVEGRALRFATIQTDTLIAQGSVSTGESRLRSVSARRGDATITASGIFERSDEEYPDMDFTAEWVGWDARQIVDFLEWDLEAEGIVSGRADTVRRDERYTGGGEVRGVAGSVLEQPFDEVRIAWNMDGETARLAPMSGLFRGGTADGTLDIGLWEWELQGRITGRDYPLTPGLAPEWISIRSDFSLEVGGDLLVPELLLTARVPEAAVLGLPLGAGSVVGTVHGERFESHGALDSGEVSFEMSGVVPIGTDGAGTVTVGAVDVSPLLSDAAGAAGYRVVVGGTGDFHIEDPLDEWMEGTVRLSGLTVTGPGLDARLGEPARLRIEDARVFVEGLELVQEGSRLALAGSVGLDDLLLDFVLAGRTRLAAAAALAPGVDAEGTLEVDAEIIGLATEPEFHGTGTIRGGAFRVAGFPHALSEVEGQVAFDRRTIHVAEVIARFASGRAVISGAVSFDDVAVGGVDLGFQLADARLQYPEDLSASVEADLRLVGDRGRRLLSGSVRLDEAVWSREYELFSSILADVNSVSIPREPSERGFLGDLHLDVHVETDAPFAVRNSVFELDAAADFDLRGSAASPAILGRADLVGGEVYFGAHRFQVVSGRADFVDPQGIEPVFDIEAETTVRSYRVSLRASGTTEQIEASLNSDPPLREADIWRLLSGAPDQALLTSAADDEVAAASTASLLSQQLTAMVGSRAGRVFGIDRLSIDPFLIGRFSNPAARVTLAKQLSRDLNVRYSSSLSSAEESIIVVEYTPQGPVSWIFSRDRDGSLGVDVRFRRIF